MARHFNTTLSEQALRVFRTKQGDHVGSEVLPVLQPIVDVGHPPLNISRDQNASNTTSATIFTTPTDKDFYLVSCDLSVTKDATSTSTSSGINVTIDGSTQRVATLGTLTLNAQSLATNKHFGYPGIKLDRNTAVSVVNGTGVANINSYATIQGYTVETTSS